MEISTATGLPMKLYLFHAWNCVGKHVFFIIEHTVPLYRRFTPHF